MVQGDISEEKRDGEPSGDVCSRVSVAAFRGILRGGLVQAVEFSNYDFAV